jgi:hypothetical protein
MELLHSSHASGRQLSVDWTLIAITTVAAALLVGTMVRTGPDTVPGDPVRMGGLQVLAENEHLVSFEDFSFGAQDWDAARPAGRMTGVLGPFAQGAVTKDFVLPADTARVEVTFDLRLTGGWTGEGLSVSVNGQPVIEDLSLAQASGDVVIRDRDAEGGYSVWIALDDPGAALSLRLEATEGAGPTWMIDNVSVVASTAAS